MQSASQTRLCVCPHICADLKAWAAASPSEWPDVAFHLNTGDSSVCKGVSPGRGMASWGPCPGPVFSMIKEWGAQR